MVAEQQPQPSTMSRSPAPTSRKNNGTAPGSEPLVTANDRAVRATLDASHRKISEATTDVEFQYRWEGGTDRCISAKATYHGVVIGTAKVLGTGGDKQTGFYVEVEEVQYEIGAANQIIYTGRLRFHRGRLGTKLTEVSVSGKKRYALFEIWPMGEGN
jgi:hypothetical protein